MLESTNQVDQLDLLGTRDVSGLACGLYTLRLSVKDKANRICQAKRSVLVDDCAPVHYVTDSLDHDLLYKNGESISLVTYWDEPGYTLSANFGVIDSEYRQGY